MANPLAHKAQKAFQNRDNQFKQFINDMIKAPTIVVIDAEGANMGTFNRLEALRIAEEQGLDLIQMSYNASTMTSTCRLMDYGKFQYMKKKGEADKRQTQSKGMKELEISYNIGDNDLEMKINKGKEILSEGYQLRFAIKLRGRENMFRDKALAKLQRAVEWIGEEGKCQGIKTEPKGYSAIFGPKGKK